MSEQQLDNILGNAFLMCLKEAYEEVQGPIFIDRGTTLFETLATLSAVEASTPIGSNCATVAAHVAHMVYYNDVLLKFAQGEKVEMDWEHIWNTVTSVSNDEWEASKAALRTSYETVRDYIAAKESWTQTREIALMQGILMHAAYHLGEIRHALCTLKPERE